MRDSRSAKQGTTAVSLRDGRRPVEKERSESARLKLAAIVLFHVVSAHTQSGREQYMLS